MRVDTTRDIREVVKSRLCLSCGACAAVCSVKAISFNETAGGYLYPKINDSTCVHCGLCYEVCPGVHYIEEIHARYLKASYEDSIASAYVGKALDEKIFKNGQSGGVVSGLLKCLFEQNAIDGVLCAGMSSSMPPRGRAFFITDENELSRAQKSKYVPVALLENIRKYITGCEKIAVVGLPCHMHGIELLGKVIPGINEKIILKVGLVCEQILTAKSIDYLSLKATEKPVSEVIFRDKQRSGYPGAPSVKTADGEVIMMQSTDRMAIKEFFTPVRCRLCLDKLNMNADVVCGDPHGMDEVDRVHGETLVLVRSERGKRVIEDAVRWGYIELRRVSVDKAVSGQHIKARVKDWSAYLQAWKTLEMRQPEGAESKQVKGNKALKLYKNDLKQGLFLDNYDSVEKILIAVDGWLMKNRMQRVITTPLRIAKKVAKRLKVCK